MKIISIAGGSGSGKSTLSYRLVDTYPKKVEMLTLDDYQLEDDGRNKLPTLKGMINWDHPDVIRWEKLLKDIEILRSGKPVTIRTWSDRSNPDYFEHKNMIPRTIHPKEVLIIEGYLSLWHKDLRDLYSRKYYLDIDQKTSQERRDKFVDPVYDKEVLTPMHIKYVEPTKKFADVVLNVSKMSSDEVFDKVDQDLMKEVK
ncbi:hypothetical protein IID23_00685 [Patescibacteria group bacterium]|nr:hypothetical protein [Patescibacteria group bacterium]